MQLLVKSLFNPAHVSQLSYEPEHEVQLIEQAIQSSNPKSLKPILQLFINIIYLLINTNSYYLDWSKLFCSFLCMIDSYYPN